MAESVTAELALAEEILLLQSRQKTPDDCPVCWREVDDFKKHRKGHGFLFHLACYKCKLCRRRLTEATCRIENGDWICIPGKCDDGTAVVTKVAPPSAMPASEATAVHAAKAAKPVEYEEDDSDGHLGNKAMTQLLAWCRERLAAYSEVKLTGFNSPSWSSGVAFCGLIDLFIPDLIDIDACRRCSNAQENLEIAFDLAEEELDLCGNLCEDEVNEWEPQEIFSFVGQFYVLEKQEEKRAAEEERNRQEAELVDKMSWGDAFGDIFELPEFNDPKCLTISEAQDARAAYKDGWGAVVDYLGKGHTIPEETHMRRVEAVSKLDEMTAFKPLIETSSNGGYFSEEMRTQWVQQNRKEIIALEKSVEKVLSGADAESDENIAALGRLQLQLELHRQFAEQLTAMAGRHKGTNGDVTRNERLQKEAEQEAAQRAKDSIPFGTKRKLCHSCNRLIYKLEDASSKEFKGKWFHSGCFRCSACNSTLRVEHGVHPHKGELYCQQHITWATQPQHPFGDPLNEYFQLEKPTDPSGLMFTWETQAAKSAYSRCYNQSLEVILQSVEVCPDHMKQVFATKSPSYARRVENCASVDRSRRFSPNPENDIRGTHFSKKLWESWMKDTETLIHKAVEDRNAFQEIEDKLAEQSSGRKRRNERRQRGKQMETKLQLVESLTRRERVRCVLYLDGCLEDLGRYKRLLLQLAHKVLGGEDPDVLDHKARAKEREAKRKAQKDAQQKVGGGRVTLTKCYVCNKNVYDRESLTVDDLVMHRVCFRCKECKTKLTPKKYIISHDDELFCVRHAPPEADSGWQISRFNPKRASRLPGRIFDDGKDPMIHLLNSALPPADPIAALEAALVASGEAKSAAAGPRSPARRKKSTAAALDEPSSHSGAPPKTEGERYAKSSFGMDKVVREKIASKYDPRAVERVLAWMRPIVGEELQGDFHDLMKSGVVLCRLINAIEPDAVAFSTKNQAFHHRNNIGNFLTVCQEWGAVGQDLFQSIDLYEGQNLNQVVVGIEAFTRVVNKRYPDKYSKLY